MLKKRIDERICEECGRLIRNRRADARKCIDFYTFVIGFFHG